MTKEYCVIARLMDSDRMRRLWDIALDAELIPGSYAPGFGMGDYQWYRVWFKSIDEYLQARNEGLVEGWVWDSKAQKYIKGE